jgi:NitT/TauT family transport system substrate-binding protein
LASRAGFLCLLAVAFAVGGSSLSASAQTLETVKLGNINSISDAPIFIADKKGYFQAEGIKVEYVTFNTGANMIAPLSTGQLDVGAGGLSAGFYNGMARGLDIRVVADKATDPPGYGFVPLLVRTDLVRSGRFKTLKDLKGMLVADSGPGTLSWPELDALTRKAGLKFDDVRHVSLGFPDELIAFRNGSIDAGLTIEPFASAAIQDGTAVKIIGSDDYYPNGEIAVLMYAGSFISNHRDTALRFMRAYLKGARYYNDALAHGKLDGPTAADVIKILTETTTVKDPAVFRRMTPNGVSPDGHLNVAAMQRDLDFFKSRGLIDGQTTAAQCIDSSFANEAAKDLGPYKPAQKK